MRAPEPYEESLRNIGRLYDALYELETNFYRIPVGPKRTDIARSINAVAEIAGAIAFEMNARVNSPPLGDG